MSAKPELICAMQTASNAPLRLPVRLGVSGDQIPNHPLVAGLLPLGFLFEKGKGVIVYGERDFRPWGVIRKLIRGGKPHRKLIRFREHPHPVKRQRFPHEVRFPGLIPLCIELRNFRFALHKVWHPHARTPLL